MKLRAVSCMGLLRVFGLSLTLCLLAGASLAHTAQRESLRVLSRLGHDLLTWEEFRPHSSPRRLHLGPLTFGVLALSHPGEVSEVLDRFQEDCRKRSVLRGPHDIPYYLDFREDRGDEGVVACLDVGDLKKPSEVLARLSELASSDDLSSVAKAHYVFARRSGSQTTAVVVWNEGHFRLNDLAHLAGLEEPGSPATPSGTPAPSPIRQPEGMREMFTAFEEGQSYAMSLHTTVVAPSLVDLTTLSNHYKKEIERAGYTLERGTPPSKAGEDLLSGRRDNAQIKIQVKRQEDGSYRVLSLFY